MGPTQAVTTTRAKGPRTTIPRAGPDTRPDLVARAFTASGPGQLWVADITDCRTFSGWVYVAVRYTQRLAEAGAVGSTGDSSGDFCLATSGDFFMATDIRGPIGSTSRVRTSCRVRLGRTDWN